MLKPETRRAIDEARDILVGKIPAPNIQVEQITIAMLYKFMDDMDHESIANGGKPTFFSGNYEKYSWREILNKQIGAQERYNKYTEALEMFYLHPDLPQTFKDIFKNATVPYKDADILTMFLRKINEGLSYEDSEQLGDAYEYLLMILGSQGDLGQFRTPRHIIDFIVQVLSPQKNEKILDPACGTGGFLISAFNYIYKSNTDENGRIHLNHDERNEILKNLTGYDIEPSMVRIAEMNMFLHGANDPDIKEHDTLTDDTFWDEKFDVILANPPFMTPKGGIKPHSKFGIKSNRSEVLFVDYIDSHLKSTGRAGIIVPDGVVFQSGTAYKELRKSIISKNLVAVVSLPNGVFMPYSGVKTSILFLNRKLAKERKEVLFVELKNDGFSLGTQRNPIQGNQIPELIDVIRKFENDENFESKLAFKVDRKKVMKDDYSLSLNKYKEVEEDDTVYENPTEIVKRLNYNNVAYQELLKKLGDL